MDLFPVVICNTSHLNLAFRMSEHGFLEVIFVATNLFHGYVYYGCSSLLDDFPMSSDFHSLGFQVISFYSFKRRLP